MLPGVLRCFCYIANVASIRKPDAILSDATQTVARHPSIFVWFHDTHMYTCE